MLHRASLCLVLVSCTSTALPEIALLPQRPAAGHVSVLDAGGPDGDTGWWPVVAFDRKASPHVAFCDAHQGDVRYAYETPAGWHVESVVKKGAVGKYIAMDVDARGHVGIGFYDQDHKYLRYAWQDETLAWQTENVAWGLEAGMGSVLRFDATGTPHLFYYLPSGRFVHAHKQVDGWHKEVLANALGAYSMRISAVLRPDGLWVSYVDWKAKNAALYLGHLDLQRHFVSDEISHEESPGWQSQVLFAGAETSQAPTIIHSRRLIRDTAITTRDAQSQWKSRNLWHQGSRFAADLWQGKLIVALQDQAGPKGGGAMRYVREREGEWSVYGIDDASPVGRYMSLAINPQGRLLLVYYADSTRSLKVYDEQLSVN